MKNVYGKDIKDNTRLTRHYQDYELEEANKDWKQNTVEDFCPRRDVSYDDCLNKLGKLEDIEEELGIGVIFLNKISKEGVYCYKKSIKEFNTLGKRLGDIIHICNSDIHIELFGAYHEKRMGVSVMGCIDYAYYSLYIKDYGKTWALTKDELE